MRKPALVGRVSPGRGLPEYGGTYAWMRHSAFVEKPKSALAHRHFARLARRITGRFAFTRYRQAQFRVASVRRVMSNRGGTRVGTSWLARGA
jgi:acetyl-CoA acetyltransferase